MIASFEPGGWPTDEGLRRNIRKIGWLNFAPGHEHLADAVFRHTVYRAAARETCFQLVRTYNVTSRLKEITVPTLIVVGAEDVFTPPSQAARLHAGIPDSELVQVQGSGHFVSVERPEIFFPAVRGWLARI
jgi:pimeloyl-ACP methyl ester carboxylesterase